MQFQETQAGTPVFSSRPTPLQQKMNDGIHILQGLPLYAGWNGQGTQVQRVPVYGHISTRTVLKPKATVYQPVSSTKHQYQPQVYIDPQENHQKPAGNKTTNAHAEIASLGNTRQTEINNFVKE